MDKRVQQSNESSISTTGTTSGSRHYSDTVDKNLKYMNLNFNENSDSSSQPKEFSIEQQRMANGHSGQSNSTKPEPSKILPPAFPLRPITESSSQSEATSVVPEKSLLEMGCSTNEPEIWKDVQPPKENLYKLLKDMIDNHIKPNVQIRIGDITFNCHMMVLQCYSDAFKELNTEVMVELPEEKVTPGAFMMVYDWMLADQPLVQREGILELFNAANFLRIQELIKQCWFCLSDDECFQEDTAFLLYLEARKYGLEVLQQLMLMRVCKFFLTLVASKEFLDLSAKEICMLLSSNVIGVNSECEILMSAVRWLSHNWEERQQHLLDVLKCVRFTLMPSWFLLALSKNAYCEQVHRVVSHPDVIKMIHDGILYVGSQIHYQYNRDEFLQFLDRLQVESPKQRRWIYDKHCSYHHNSTSMNVENTTFQSFLHYLDQIRRVGRNYWRSVDLVKDITEDKSMPCGIHSDSHKSFHPTLVAVFPQRTGNQGLPYENYEGNCLAKGRACGHLRPGSTLKRLSLHGSQKKLLQLPTLLLLSPQRRVNKSTNSSYQRGHKSRLHRCSGECPSNCANNCQSTDAEADIKTALNLKCQQENVEKKISSQWQPPEEPQYNLHRSKDHHDTFNVEAQRKHSAHSRTILPYDPIPPTKGAQQQLRRKHITKQQAHASSNVNCHRNDQTDASSVTVNVDCDAPTGQNINTLNKNYSYNARMRRSVDADVDIIIKNPIDDHLMERKGQSFTATTEKNMTLNRKIFVFGGIDPYSLHCQQHEQQHQHSVVQQGKHMLGHNATSTDMHNRTPTVRARAGDDLGTAKKCAITTTTPTSSTFTSIRLNNKYENFGDQVLIHQTEDAMEWRHLSHIPFGSRHHHAVAVCNGLIYLVGGTRTALSGAKKSIFDKSVWCFDPQTLKWTMVSSLPESRRDFAIVAVDKNTCGHCRCTNGRHGHESGFYVMGGEATRGVALSTVWFYSVGRRVWIKKPPLKMGRYGLAAAMVNNEIWIAGGIINGHDANAGVASASGCSAGGLAAAGNNVHAIRSSTGHVITDTIEIYTLKCSHEKWAPKQEEGFPNVPTAMEGSSNVKCGAGDDSIIGAIYIDSTVSNANDDVTSGGDGGACDCVVGRWIMSKQHLRVPRAFGKFCKMTNGDLYLVAGIGPSDTGDLTSLSDIDHYLVKQQQWRHCGDLNWPRHGHDVGLFNDQCFAVIGGVSTTKRRTLVDTEVFCTKTRKCLNHLLPDLPWPVSGSAVASIALK